MKARHLIVLCLAVSLVVMAAPQSKEAEVETPAPKPSAEKPTEKVTDKDVKESAAKSVGVTISGFEQLDKLAEDCGVVLVLVPVKEESPVPPSVRTAMADARTALGKDKVKAGLFTLSPSAAEYKGLPEEAKLPAIFVAAKGRGGMLLDNEKISSDALVKAYESMTNAGSGCGTRCGSACGAE